MTLEEKLRAMEALWEDLCQRDAVPVPQWHKDILDERRHLIEEGKAHHRLGDREETAPRTNRETDPRTNRQ